MAKQKLCCPKCKNEKITVSDESYKYHFPAWQLNCPNCGKFCIEHIQMIKPVEEHLENCQCGKCRHKNG